MVHQKLDHWLLMIRFERMNLVKGPKITVYIGDLAIKNVPKRAAMALSKKLNDYFNANPGSTRFDIDAGLLTANAVRTLLVHWPQRTSPKFEAHEVWIHGGFRRNIAVLQAARFLGMERYTNNIMQHHVEYMRTQIPHYDEIATVEAMRSSDKDPVWTTMVNHLSQLRHTGQIDDAIKFSKFLKRHPELASAMNRTDQYFRDKAAQKHRYRIFNFMTGEEKVISWKEAARWRESRLLGIAPSFTKPHAGIVEGEEDSKKKPAQSHR
jgi:hypothetical protein